MLYKIKKTSDLSEHERSLWSAFVRDEADCRWPFLSLPYIEMAEQVYGGVRIVVLEKDGQAQGFLPVQRSSTFPGVFSVYTPVGGGMTDYFGLISSPDLRLDIQAFLHKAGIGIVDFSHLDAPQLGHGLSANEARVGLRTMLSDTVDDYWQDRRSADGRKYADLKRCERKLLKDIPNAVYEFESSDPERDFECLIELKQQQYARTKQVNAPLHDPRNISLMRKILKQKAPDCQGVLSVLKADGRMLAGHFGMRCHERLHYWFPAYDMAFNGYSPGRLLFAFMVNEGWQRGVRMIDHGEGDTLAKREFANSEHDFYRGVWVANTACGLWSRFGLSLGWRLGW